VGEIIIVKSALTFDIGKDRLLLIMILTHNNNNSQTLSNGPGFTTDDASMSGGFRHDAVVTYQKKV
jgi:hypothetical protein